MSFDDECQSVPTSFFTFLIFAKIWPVRTILTNTHTHRHTHTQTHIHRDTQRLRHRNGQTPHHTKSNLITLTINNLLNKQLFVTSVKVLHVCGEIYKIKVMLCVYTYMCNCIYVYMVLLCIHLNNVLICVHLYTYSVFTHLYKCC